MKEKKKKLRSKHLSLGFPPRSNVKNKEPVEKPGFRLFKKVQMQGAREIDERRRIY
jgi:hypothetical protein